MRRENQNRSPNTLKPYERNARQHSETQIRQIAASIDEFGFMKPVAIDEDNMILAGHGAVEAALFLELKTIPVVKITGLSEDQKKAFILADNSLSDKATWDWEIVALEITSLQASELDIVPMGIDDLVKAKKSSGNNTSIGGDRFLLQLEFVDEQGLETAYTEMQERGIECRILT